MAYWQSGQFCHGLSKLRIFRLAPAQSDQWRAFPRPSTFRHVVSASLHVRTAQFLFYWETVPALPILPHQYERAAPVGGKCRQVSMAIPLRKVGRAATGCFPERDLSPRSAQTLGILTGRAHRRKARSPSHCQSPARPSQTGRKHGDRKKGKRCHLPWSRSFICLSSRCSPLPKTPNPCPDC